MLKRAVEACGVFESVDLYQKGFRPDEFIDCIDLASQCKYDAFRLTCCSISSGHASVQQVQGSAWLPQAGVSEYSSRAALWRYSKVCPEHDQLSKRPYYAVRRSNITPNPLPHL